MTGKNKLSSNDLKFYWKIDPIKREERRIKVLIQSEEFALQRLTNQRKAAIKKTEVEVEKNELENISRVQDNNEFHHGTGRHTEDNNHQETVLRLRLERRRKKLRRLHQEKLEILWNYVENWLDSECERLAKEPTKTISKTLSRLAKCYDPIPLLQVNELSSWVEIEKHHKNCEALVEYEDLDEEVNNIQIQGGRDSPSCFIKCMREGYEVGPNQVNFFGEDDYERLKISFIHNQDSYDSTASSQDVDEEQTDGGLEKSDWDSACELRMAEINPSDSKSKECMRIYEQNRIDIDDTLIPNGDISQRYDERINDGEIYYSDSSSSSSNVESNECSYNPEMAMWENDSNRKENAEFYRYIDKWAEHSVFRKYISQNPTVTGPPPGFQCADSVNYLTAPSVKDIEEGSDVHGKISFVAETKMAEVNFRSEKNENRINSKGGNSELPIRANSVVPSLDLHLLNESVGDEESPEIERQADASNTFNGNIILRDSQSSETSSIYTDPNASPPEFSSNNTVPAGCSTPCMFDTVNSANQEVAAPSMAPVHNKGIYNPFDFSFQGGMVKGAYDQCPTPRYEDSLLAKYARLLNSSITEHNASTAAPCPWSSGNTYYQQNACPRPFVAPPSSVSHCRLRLGGNIQRCSPAIRTSNLNMNKPGSSCPRYNSLIRPDLQTSWQQQPSVFPTPAQMNPNEIAANHIKRILNVGNNSQNSVATLPPPPALQYNLPHVAHTQATNEAAELAYRKYLVESQYCQQQRFCRNTSLFPRRVSGPVTFNNPQKICLVRPHCQRTVEPTQNDRSCLSRILSEETKAATAMAKESEIHVVERIVEEGDRMEIPTNSSSLKQSDHENQSSMKFFPSSCVFDNFGL